MNKGKSDPAIPSIVESSADAEEADSAATGSEHKAGVDKKEIGGREGPDPTRYGDWEKNGRCIDF